MRRAIALALVGAGAIGLRREPQVFREATSPDGTWSVAVLRQKNPLYPILEGVSVIVRVQDAGKNTLHEQKISWPDRWDDVEDRFYDVTCSNESLSVGPRYWDGEKGTHFRLEKKTLPNRAP